MSDAQRYQHIGSLVRSSPKMRELYPEATVYVLASDYDALRAELSAIKGGGEAVAVMYADGSVLTKAECGSAFEICCKAQTPLYTSPPVVAEAEPLREALRELRSALEPEDWMGDISMHAFIDAALTAPPASGAVPVPRELLTVACSGGNEAWQAPEELRALLAKGVE